MASITVRNLDDGLKRRLRVFEPRRTAGPWSRKLGRF